MQIYVHFAKLYQALGCFGDWTEHADTTIIKVLCIRFFGRKKFQFQLHISRAKVVIHTVVCKNEMFTPSEKGTQNSRQIGETVFGNGETP